MSPSRRSRITRHPTSSTLNYTQSKVGDLSFFRSPTMSPFRSFSPFRPTNFSPLSGGNVDFATFIQGQGKAWYGNNTHSPPICLIFLRPLPKFHRLQCVLQVSLQFSALLQRLWLARHTFLATSLVLISPASLEARFFRCPFLNGFSAWRAASSARRASSHLWIQMPWLRTICSIFSSLLVSSFLSSSIRDLAQLVFPLFVFPHAIVPSLSHVPDQQTTVLKVA